MYSEACEAQGMTLADLLSKQNGTYSIDDVWPKGKEVDTEYLANIINGYRSKILHAPSNGPLTIYNRPDYGADFRLDIYYGSGQEDSVTVKKGETLDLSYRAGYIIMSANGTVLIEFVNVNYYNSFGLSHVELPDDCTNVKAMWDDVCTRVNEKYWKRYLSCETLEEWQVELQVLTDAVVRRYERALRLYDANADAIEKEFGARQVTEYGNLKDTSSQTKNATSNTTVSATPDQKINDDETYAGTTSNGFSNAGTTEHTRTGKITVTQVGGDSMLGAINDNVAKWHDIETELVDEYAHVFMSYIWS